ncbi:glypican-1b [Oryzias melastigma]|uniref:Glypican-1 n=1 Tax=Oryzias melastigma TaxID=30732 RepID=A0A3B3CVY3_ORYME|nr:glypican-1b [Oryzias melastigma]XP_024129828.1 glypican-1b [Oryzias melastigma]
MESLIIAALALCSLTAPACGDKGTSKARSCSDLRQFYGGKGYSVDKVPLSEISGEHLHICPQGYTCCTVEMEGNLASLSCKEMEGLLKDAGRALQTSLLGQHKAFDGFFLDLLNRSMARLQRSFASTRSLLHLMNSQVFSDLYNDLSGYCRGTSINLEEVLNEFWAKLLEKLVYQKNKQISLGEDYLECVSKQIETIRPFGESPHKTSVLVTRTFLAARSFLQGLMKSAEVVRKVSQVPLSPACMRAMMRMTYCPHCRGIPSARPCANYCSNVMKGCLANQADLNTEWKHLVDTMVNVAENRLINMDQIILSLPDHILEAISTMMEKIDTINAKLSLACGEVGPISTEAEEVRTAGRVTVEDTVGDPSKNMEKLVSDVTTRLRGMQSHWVSLPNILCSDRAAYGAGAEDKCWNGINRARYLPEVMGDGLANQISNPEVEIDITKPDMTIRQQIMQLKITSNRLKNALNGFDVDFQDTSDDPSGSGSGSCTDPSCSQSPGLIATSTGGPVFYPYPPENKKVTGSAQQNVPSIIIFLLSLFILLLRR